MYAVNLCDLMELKRVDPIGMLLFKPEVLSTRTVEVEGNRIDTSALRLTCDEERGQAILALIRKKYRKNQLRMYYSKTGNGSWKRV